MNWFDLNAKSYDKVEQIDSRVLVENVFSQERAGSIGIGENVCKAKSIGRIEWIDKVISTVSLFRKGEWDREG